MHCRPGEMEMIRRREDALDALDALKGGGEAINDY